MKEAQAGQPQHQQQQNQQQQQAYGQAGQSSALAGQKEEESGSDDEHGEPVHHKFNVGVFNWGSLRRKGEAIYAKNVYNLPIFVALTMEMTP